jgi:hypothetical protein
MSFAVLAPVSASGALTSLSPWTINVGQEIFFRSESTSALKVLARVANAICRETLIIMFLVQVRVSVEVSGLKKGSSFSPIQRGKSVAIALVCASITSFGNPSGLSEVFIENGVAGAASTSRAIRSAPLVAQYRAASKAPMEWATRTASRRSS